MGCGISSNSPVVTKSRLAGRTSRVEDCSPLEKPSNQRADSAASLNSLHHQAVYSAANGYLTNGKTKSPTTTDPNSPDLADPMIASQMNSSVEQPNLQYNPHFAKNQRGITAVLSKTLSNNKSIDQLEGESDRQTGKDSVETNNSQNDSNYGSSYSAEMSKTPIQITGDNLQQFLEIEQQIQLLEKKHVLDEYLIRTEQLEKLETSLEQIKTNKYRCLEDLISIQKKMGYKDLQSVKEFITKKSYVDNTLNLEEELFLDTLNKKEMLERDFDNLTQQQNMLKQKIDQLANEGEKLQLLFTNRDQLLDQIFDGQYGSNLENHLEKELDWLLEQKHHVDQAYFRWKQAHLCVKQACKHLTEAIENWKHYLDIPVDENETRYQVVAETRNLLLSGSQQLQNCQRYLNNIELPYCSQEEIETLEKAISYIFTDMQSQERHEHALACYQTTFKRANALKQWLEQVLNMTISRDLYLINEDCKSRTSELRNERIRLIKNRIKELNGSGSSTNNTNYDLRDSGVDSELDDTAVDEQIAKLFENGRNKKDPKSLTPDPTRMPFAILSSSQLNGGAKDNNTNYLPNGGLNNRSTPKYLNHQDSGGNSQAKYKQALAKYDQNFADKFDNMPAGNSSTPSNGSSLNEPLAPIPSSEQIFGRINELKQRFKNEIDQIKRQQQFSQAKMAQGLREKLNERRHRRSRAAMNDREIQALNANVDEIGPMNSSS